MFPPGRSRSQGGRIVVNANQEGTITFSLAYTTNTPAILLGNNFRLISTKKDSATVLNLVNGQVGLPWATFGW